MTSERKHPRRPWWLICGCAFSAALSTIAYCLSLLRGLPLWAAVNGICVLINVYSLMVCLGYERWPHRRKTAQCYPVARREPLGPEDPLLANPDIRCLLCHRAFQSGDYASFVPILHPTDLKGGHILTLAAHTNCLRLFAEITHTQLRP